MAAESAARDAVPEVLRLYFISDRTLTPAEPPAGALVDAIRAGVDMVQVREKDLGARDLLDVVRCAVEAARGTPAAVMVNSRFDVALAARADGVHLPASGLAAADVRRASKGMLRIGVSTHSLDEARAAMAQGADFITFGPVFDTPSKRRYGPPAGLERLREVVANVALPVYALGGIKPANVEKVIEIPVAGVAVISAIACAVDRARAVESFRAAARRVRGEG